MALIVKFKLPAVALIPDSQLFPEVRSYVVKSYLFPKGRKMFEGKPPSTEDIWALHLFGGNPGPSKPLEKEKQLEKTTISKSRRKRRKFKTEEVIH